MFTDVGDKNANVSRVVFHPLCVCTGFKALGSWANIIKPLLCNVSGKPFHPSLMYESKEAKVPSKHTSAVGLAHKYLTWEKVSASNKHASLLQIVIR